MKKILIVSARDLKSNMVINTNHKDILMASLVLVTNGQYFRCLKNRYGPHSDEDEKIPVFLMGAYIAKYSEHFTREELIDSLI